MTRLEPDSDHPSPASGDSHPTPARAEQTNAGKSNPQQRDTDASTGPRHSVAHCPICDGGLCSVRAFFDHSVVPNPLAANEPNIAEVSRKLSHGLVICDECEAIWLQPDIRGVHVYPDAQTPHCPVTGKPLYDWQTSRWATSEDVASLGWSDAINPSLTYDPSGDANSDA